MLEASSLAAVWHRRVKNPLFREGKPRGRSEVAGASIFLCVHQKRSDGTRRLVCLNPAEVTSPQ
jgi:hypothetical protein